MTKKKLFEEFFDNEKKAHLAEFFEFLRFQSISSEEAFRPQVAECADWLKERIKELGFKVELWPADDHPVLFAEKSCGVPGAKTILFYNHYDVQPVDPLELWKTPPFEPIERDGEIYARGAQDNKGQLFYVYLAIKALLKLNGSLPVNIKWVIEGGEECGSVGLARIVHEKKEALKSDFLTIVDVGIASMQAPSVTLGTRGLVTFEMKVTGSSTDLHSGVHGGLAYNPLHAIVEILGSLRNPDGSINIPGFYDSVVPTDEATLSQIELGFDEAGYEKTFGAAPKGGEKKLPPKVRNWLRPTLEINGLHGGYGGSGFKTVIPKEAMAKFSCRLVAGQDPQKIAALVTKRILEIAPDAVSVEVTALAGSGSAARGDERSAAVKAFSKALTEVFERPCKFVFEGASIPVLPELTKASGAQMMLMGLGLATDNIHAPNEHFSVERLKKGMCTIALGLEYLSS